MNEELPKPGYIAVPRSDTDYVKGDGHLGAVSLFQGFDWRAVRPMLDLQNKNGLETSGCVSWTAVQFNEEYLNALIKLEQLPQTHLDFLDQNGYIVNGLVVFSKIFIWNLSGTTQNGNDFTSVGNAIVHNGLIPESMCPFNPTQGETWAELKAQPITQAMLDMGQKFLNYFGVGYHYINGSDWATELNDAPVQIAIPVCPGYNTADPIQSCGLQESHSVLLDYMNGNEPQIVDHYNPEIKDLASNYPIMASLQYVITIKTPMTNALITQNGSEYGIFLPATSQDGLITLLRNIGVTPPLNADGTVNFTELNTMVQATLTTK